MSETEQKRKAPLIYFGQPVYHHVSPIAHQAFAQLTAYTPNVRCVDIRVDTYLPKARSHIAEAAIKAWRDGKATHLFWCDSDMTFPIYLPAVVDGQDVHLPLSLKLIQHGEKIVSGVYYKHDDARPVAMTYHPDADGWLFLNHIPKTGTIRADCVGLGCCIMDISFLADMKAKYGDELFQMPLQKDGTTMGEDCFFFKRAHEMGVDVLIDCDVQCGHAKLELVTRETHEAFWEQGAGKDIPNGVGVEISNLMPAQRQNSDETLKEDNDAKADALVVQFGSAVEATIESSAA